MSAPKHHENSTKIEVNASTGALYLVLIQVASRALTFLGNQVLLRYLSPAQLGLAVQLELVSVTVLYTSRESLRVALQRQPATYKSSDAMKQANREAQTSQQTVNLAYLVLLVGLCASTIFGYGYLRQLSDEVLQSTDFSLAFILYGLATLVELLAEPCFVVIQQHSLYKDRARAETGAAIARCVSACLTAIIMHSRKLPVSVLPFAVGQLFYAGTLFTVYLAGVIPVAIVKHFSLLPRKIHSAQTQATSQYWMGLFAKPLLILTMTFYAQSVFKLLLTQGDSLILSLIADLKSQGAFALASNYGGLLSRLLFQPIEESSRNIFGRLLASSVEVKDNGGNVNPNSTIVLDDQSTRKSSSSQISSPQTSKSSHSRPRDDVNETDTSTALTHLSTILHTYTLFSLPILTLLPYLFPPLITTLIGARWSSPETSELLSAYSYYLPFLAINGILDAFVTSVATPSQLRSQSVIMAGVTGIYGLVAWILIAPPSVLSEILGGFQGIGPGGLVWANIVNMFMRIVYSVTFIKTWMNSHVRDRKSKINDFWTKSSPSPFCIATAACVTIALHMFVNLTDANKKAFMGIKGLGANDLGVLMGGGIVLATSIVVFEYQFLISALTTILPQRFAPKVLPYLPKQKAQ